MNKDTPTVHPIAYTIR